MNLLNVNVTTIENETGQELSDTCYRVCAFCDKIVRVHALNFVSCEKLSGNKFYCPFCLRNNFHHRSNRHVLKMSMRGIIGFYYYKFYKETPKIIYLCELNAMIDKHRNYGLQNPTFSYDTSNFMWYVDFNKIGNHSRKAPFTEVKETLTSMLNCFDMKKLIGANKEEDMVARFTKAFELFYEKRQRPQKRKALIPTFNGILHTKNNEEFFNCTRNFVKNSLSAI